MHRQYGFTLIELAMVLFIVALLLGGIMSPLSIRMEQAKRSETEEILKQIRESLLGYALIKGHLPCPDCPDGSVGAGCSAIDTNDPAEINDGVEDGVDSGNNRVTRDNFEFCATEMGNVPWVTLGVPEYDAWGRRFVYSVDETFADNLDGTTGCSPSLTLGISFEICSTADMAIVDAAGNTVADNVPALAYSLGSNGEVFGGTAPASAAELENWWTTAGNRDFTSNTYVQAAGSEFDDILVWISSPTLMYRMVSAELLP